MLACDVTFCVLSYWMHMIFGGPSQQLLRLKIPPLMFVSAAACRSFDRFFRDGGGVSGSFQQGACIFSPQKAFYFLFIIWSCWFISSLTNPNPSSRAPLMSPVNTISANQPTTSRPSWRSTLETWAAPVAGVGAPVEGGEAAAGEAAGRHAGEDAPKR